MGRLDNEPVALEFLADGRLAYVVLSDGRTQIMKLTYRIDDGMLVTDQPSAPSEVRSPFRLDGDNLTISFEGVSSQFRRER